MAVAFGAAEGEVGMAAVAIFDSGGGESREGCSGACRCATVVDSDSNVSSLLSRLS